jgi:hypothetical protein
MPQSQIANDHTTLFNDGLAGRADSSPCFEKMRLDAAAGALTVGAELVFYARVDVGPEPDLWICLLDLCCRERESGGVCVLEGKVPVEPLSGVIVTRGMLTTSAKGMGR